MSEDSNDTDRTETRAIWMRGVWMVILLVLFSLAQTVLVVIALLQFGWMLFGKAHNRRIADFGASLAGWMAQNVRFQSGVSEEKPFPWSDWR